MVSMRPPGPTKAQSWASPAKNLPIKATPHYQKEGLVKGLLATIVTQSGLIGRPLFLVSFWVVLMWFS